MWHMESVAGLHWIKIMNVIETESEDWTRECRCKNNWKALGSVVRLFVRWVIRSHVDHFHRSAAFASPMCSLRTLLGTNFLTLSGVRVRKRLLQSQVIWLASWLEHTRVDFLLHNREQVEFIVLELRPGDRNFEALKWNIIKDMNTFGTFPAKVMRIAPAAWVLSTLHLAMWINTCGQNIWIVIAAHCCSLLCAPAYFVTVWQEVSEQPQGW